eukprot:COSAG03_NODE_8124_length_834_cov_24408.746939_2_plen_58_part_00
MFSLDLALSRAHADDCVPAYQHPKPVKEWDVCLKLTDANRQPHDHVEFVSNALHCLH